jgi:hypothetical protein
MSAPIEDLPCLRCPTPRGEDIRHRLEQGDALATSPTTGLPLDCCRIQSTPIVHAASTTWRARR